MNILTDEIAFPSLPLTPRLRWVYWALASLVPFLPLPWITNLQLYGNSDALFYTNILAFIRDSLNHGELFPRWFAEANAGTGSPVMFFYVPLAYTITALITLPLTFLDLTTGQQFLLGMYVSQLAGAYTSYLWLKRHFLYRVAFLGSLMYVLLPYKLIYIYLHLNLAQLWALVFLPLWLCAAEDICDDVPASAALYALSLTATYYCHSLTVLAFGAIPFAYVLMQAQGRIRCYLRLLIAHLLAAIMCAWQAHPQALFRGWIHIEGFLTGRLSWKEHFFHLDVFLCLYYGIAAILVCYGAWKLPKIFSTSVRRSIFFWGAVIAITFFMTQRISTPLWEYITPLQYLQFPAARLHAGAMIGAIYLMCTWLSYADKLAVLGPTFYRPSIMLVFILFFTIATINRVKDVYSNATFSNREYLGETQHSNIIPVPEYKTIWNCGDAGKTFTMYHDHKLTPMVQTKEAFVRTITWNPPQDIAIDMTTESQKADLLLRQCYVPLWVAHDEKGNDLPITPEPETGLIHIKLPQGAHHITVSLGMPENLRILKLLAQGALLLTTGWLLSALFLGYGYSCKKLKENA